jgi:selenocysteine lyase/cysteine desulfurase
MPLTRRDLVGAASSLSLAALASQPAAGAPPALPDKASFAPSGLTYLDSGTQHPISSGARAALESYIARRALDPAAAAYELPEDEVRAKFARLINAKGPDEVAYVPSTTAGEQLVLRGLGLPQAGAHIVCDNAPLFRLAAALRGDGAPGLSRDWVRAKDGRIPLSEMKAAIGPDTRLVALSLVSTINGFEHDLKAVCDLAHANDALVYADIIHAAGAVPVDVQASGVDFRGLRLVQGG